MKKGGAKPTRAQQRAIVLVTAGFIAASAALHVLLGGVFPRGQWNAAPAPSQGVILIGRLETPPPTSPPTPRPSPTPRLAQASPSPAPRPVRPQTAPDERHHRPTPSEPSASIPQVSGPAQPQVQPPAPQASAPADLRQVITDARFIQQVQPQYPRDAINASEEGTVVVLVTVGPQGPSDARILISSGYPSLDRAALQAAKESTYSVPEVNGQPATETYRIIYTFDLNS